MAIVSYFKKTSLDESFYLEHIKDRIPSHIIDMHLHISLEKFLINASPDPSDWSVQCGSRMSVEDYYAYAAEFYPDSKVEANALPAVTKGMDVLGNNAYVAELKREGKVRYAHMLNDPSRSGEETERELIEGNFDGYKPYPDFVSGVKGFDIGMFDFISEEQYKVLDKHKKTMVLHLPRPGRFPDDSNIRELREIRQKYPDIKIIIAHCGRSYAIDLIKEAHRKLGDDRNGFHYDLAAVLNPAVLDYMLENFPQNKIMYGTDLPIFLWHGRRRWTNTEYFNLCREDFAFNRHEEGPEAESKYTFFIYEQLKNILDSTYKYGGKELAEAVFAKNAEALLG